jgi:LysM repeat protein
VKLPGRRPVEPPPHDSHEKSRLCPQCGTPVSSRATTCAICGYDFVAAQEAAQIIQAAQREEAAQRPVLAIAIGVSAALGLLLIAALYVRNRSEAIAALTPTATPTSTITPTPSRTPTATPTPPFSPTPLPPREYRVQPGDTIFYIADIFQVDYRDILAFNDLTENSILQVNQAILIPPPTATPTPSPTPREATLVFSPTPSELIYVVQQGDTVIGIAQKLGVSASVILAANDIQNPDEIREGDQLVIPLGGVAQAAPTPGGPTPLPNYGPVTLLQPLNGSRIVGNQLPVWLQWLSVGLLHETETYRVVVEQVDGSIPPYGPIYIRATSLHLPTNLHPAPDDRNRTFRWTVTVVRQVGVGSDGAPLYNVVSLPASRTFQWLPDIPTATLTPVPNPR